MLMLAEPVPAAEALRLGLLTRLVDADEEVLPAAQELAARLAAGPTVAYGPDQAAAADRRAGTLAEALAAEAEAQGICGDTVDHRTATAAFVAKEKPQFTGRVGRPGRRRSVLLRVEVGLFAEHEGLHGQLVAARRDERGQLTRAELIDVGPEARTASAGDAASIGRATLTNQVRSGPVGRPGRPALVNVRSRRRAPRSARARGQPAAGRGSSRSRCV